MKTKQFNIELIRLETRLSQLKWFIASDFNVPTCIHYFPEAVSLFEKKVKEIAGRIEEIEGRVQR